MSFVPIHQAGSLAEAQIIRGLLESEGLKVMLPGEELNDEFGAAYKMTGAMTLLVPEEQATRAKEILDVWKERAEEAPPAD